MIAMYFVSCSVGMISWLCSKDKSKIWCIKWLESFMVGTFSELYEFTHHEQIYLLVTWHYQGHAIRGYKHRWQTLTHHYLLLLWLLSLYDGAGAPLLHLSSATAFSGSLSSCGSFYLILVVPFHMLLLVIPWLFSPQVFLCHASLNLIPWLR